MTAITTLADALVQTLRERILINLRLDLSSVHSPVAHRWAKFLHVYNACAVDTSPLEWELLLATIGSQEMGYDACTR